MAAGIADAGTGLLAMRAKTERTARESEFAGLWRERALETVRRGGGGDDHAMAEGYGGRDGRGLARWLLLLYCLDLAVLSRPYSICTAVTAVMSIPGIRIWQY